MIIKELEGNTVVTPRGEVLIEFQQGNEPLAIVDRQAKYLKQKSRYKITIEKLPMNEKEQG